MLGELRNIDIVGSDACHALYPRRESRAVCIFTVGAYLFAMQYFSR